MRLFPLVALACSVVPNPPKLAVIEVQLPVVCDRRRMHEAFVDLRLGVGLDEVRFRRRGPDEVVKVGPGSAALRTALLEERDRLARDDVRLGAIVLYVPRGMGLQQLVHLLDALPTGFEGVHLASAEAGLDTW